jgi:hypothetical protein
VTEDPLDQLAPRIAKGLAIAVCIVVGGAVYFVAGFVSIWDGACEGMSCATRTSSVLMALGVAIIATPIAVVVHRAHPKWTWVVALVACAEAAWSIASTHGSTLVASARGTGGPAVAIDAERVTVGSAKLVDSPGRLRSVLGAGRRGRRRVTGRVSVFRARTSSRAHVDRRGLNRSSRSATPVRGRRAVVAVRF